MLSLHEGMQQYNSSAVPNPSVVVWRILYKGPPLIIRPASCSMTLRAHTVSYRSRQERPQHLHDVHLCLTKPWRCLCLGFAEQMT